MIDVIDLLTGYFRFLSDLADRGGIHAGIMADKVIHIRWKVSIGRPILIDTDVIRKSIGVTEHLYIASDDGGRY